MIKFDLPKNQSSIIKVIGVGGGGSNAVTHMFNQGIKGVDFIICNTDAQAMETSSIPTKIQLGETGLGAGSIPSVGRKAAIENIEDIKSLLEKNTKMLFITAGMGGGTGTGAAPVIASVAKDLGILTVGIVTIPFSFEGRKRLLQAEQGINELRTKVDTLLVVSNDKLRELHGDLKLSQAFHQADNILTTAAKGIAEIVTVTGYINVDFEDVKSVMEDSGKAIMGSAMAEGESRAIEAVKGAMSSPLLDDNDISGASNILLYIASGEEEISMDEVTEITDYIQNESDQNAEIIWGNGIDDELGDNISVTIIATGFDSKRKKQEEYNQNKTVYTLDQTMPVESVKEKSKTPIITENIQLVDKDEYEENTEEEIEAPVVESKEKRTVVFDLNSPDLDKTEDNKPPQKIQLNEPTLMKRAEKRNEPPIFNMNNPPQRVEEPEHAEEVSEIEERSQDRIKKLKDLSVKLKSPREIEKMEKQPAYLRRKVELKEPNPASESLVSKYSLSEDEDQNTTLRLNNSFLHENVD